MGDAEQKPANAPQPASSGKQNGERNWVPMGIGAALVIVVLALVIVFTRGGAKTEQVNPYSGKLVISNLHMATAQNFAGGTVTYIEGSVTNIGDKKVTGASVHVVFKNPLGEVIQPEVLPVMVLLPNAPYVDYGPLERAPLAPGQSRAFRLTLEHISADWNGQIPEVKTVSVTTS